MPNLVDQRHVYAGADLAWRAYVGDVHVAELYENLAPNPSFEATSGTVTAFANLFTNPSFETALGTVTVRTNLAKNPRAISGGAVWATALAAGGTATSTYETSGGPAVSGSWYRASITAMPTASGSSLNMGTGASGYADVVAGTSYTASVYGYNSAGHAAARCDIYWFDAAGALLSSSIGTASAMGAGTWERRSVSASAPASAVRAVVAMAWSGGSTLPVGTTIGATAALLETGTTLGAYFDGTGRPRLRENIAINPALGGNLTGINGGGATVSDGTTYVRATLTDATLTDLAQRIANGPGAYLGRVAPGQTVTLWAMGRTSAAVPSMRVQIDWIASDGTTSLGVVSGAATTVNASTFNALSAVTAVAPANAAYAKWRIGIAGTGARAIGDTFDVQNIMMEVAASAGTFFSGATTAPTGFGFAWVGTAQQSVAFLYDADLSVSWTGTANASTSVLTGVGVAAVDTGFPERAARIQSSHWSASGTKSIRVIPSYDTGGNTFAAMGNVNVTSGQVYTILGTVRLPAALTGTLSGNALAFTLSGTGTGTLTYSSSATNAPGVYTVRATFTATATGAMQVRLWSGALAGGGDVWWDNALIVAGVYTGPYFDGANRPRLRENLASDPAATVFPIAAAKRLGWEPNWYGSGGGAGTTTLVTGGIGPVAGITTYQRKTWTAAPMSASVTGWSHARGWQQVTQEGFPVSAGEVITVSSWVRSSASGKTARIAVHWHDVTGTWTQDITGTPTALTAGQWTQISRTYTVPAGMMTATFVTYMDGTAWAIGETLDGTGLLVERSASVGEYFDGGVKPASAPDLSVAWAGTANASQPYVYDGDLDVAWNGTANASSTSMRGASIVSATAAQQECVAFSSTRWAGDRLKSMRLTPTMLTAGDAAVRMAGSSSGMTGNGITFVAGKSYVVNATIRLSAALTGTPASRSRRIVVIYNTAPGTPGATSVLSSQPANAAGVYDLSVSFTLPVGTVWCAVYLYHGGAGGSGDVWWDKFLVTQRSTYTKGYFDGASVGDGQPYWLGTPDASASRWWTAP